MDYLSLSQSNLSRHRLRTEDLLYTGTGHNVDQDRVLNYVSGRVPEEVASECRQEEGLFY